MSAKERHAAIGDGVENGVRGVTMTEVARRSGVHATSLDRRWGSVEDLVLDALLDVSGDTLTVPDTGSLRGDLRAFARLLADYLISPLGTALVRSMSTVEDDSATSDARRSFWLARSKAAGVMIERAAARGDIAADVDPRIVLEMVIAPIHFRRLLTREVVDDRMLDAVVDITIGGLSFPS
ncbi:TetR-like C-terminal domain-containing protein [Gordonia spumicola]|uniref:TetR-like C-terminal domain-containing protein n=1 Tax=Gordonia spumicola TaxID=589161 RepID=UPI00137A6EFF|nr:TetR-like C-terminal domain-containing protein [Gordonia spumicola]